MNKRERVLAAVNLDRPDRAPIRHLLSVPAALMINGEKLISILGKYPDDFSPPVFKIPKPEELGPESRKGICRDEWGITWKSSMNGLFGHVYDCPIKTWDDLDDYEFPPLPLRREIDKMKTHVRKHKGKGYFTSLSFNPRGYGCYFEKMWQLRGFRNLMVDFIKKPKKLYEFADRLQEYVMNYMEMVLDAKPDEIKSQDDWGNQKGLMVRPEFWREFFKPRYKKMFDLVHEQGAYLYFHSDGYIMDILPDLIEVGVNVLNPQFSCHRLEELAEMAIGKVCIASDIDRQYLLPRGEPEEVEAYVERVIDLLGYQNDGGLILMGEINLDAPLENVEAMYRAFVKYGEYNW